jgi:hypothetical protein
VQLKKNNDETIIYDVYSHKNRDLTDLIEILRNNNVVKIIHSARQDVEAIFYRFNIAMKNIFDTQLAYKYLKFNQKKNAEIGYSTIVKEFCNVDINKSKTLQKSNWLKRPLTEQQLKYAKLDVEYLYEKPDSDYYTPKCNHNQIIYLQGKNNRTYLYKVIKNKMEMDKYTYNVINKLDLTESVPILYNNKDDQDLRDFALMERVKKLRKPYFKI